MNIDFDMAKAVSAGTHAVDRFDWHGLRSRLVAAYAARPVIEGETPRETPMKALVQGGSFDSGSARALAVLGPLVRESSERRLDGVNPVALANGNWARDNHAAVAGAYPAGD
jgi:hypothetical protein